MPALANPRHERFAQELAKGRTATDAYEIAGYKPNDGNAATLKGNQRISDRVAELQNAASMRVEVTLASLLSELDEARELAMQIEQPAAAVSAIREKGVLAGIRVERQERLNRYDARQLTDEELDAAIAAALAREEAAQLDPSQLN